MSRTWKVTRRWLPSHPALRYDPQTSARLGDRVAMAAGDVKDDFGDGAFMPEVPTGTDITVSNRSGERKSLR